MNRTTTAPIEFKDYYFKDLSTGEKVAEFSFHFKCTLEVYKKTTLRVCFENGVHREVVAPAYTA